MFKNVVVYKLYIKLKCAHSLENLIKIQAVEIRNQKSLHHILRMFTIKVLYICFSFGLLAHKSRDISGAETKITEQIHKMTTVSTCDNNHFFR